MFKSIIIRAAGFVFVWVLCGTSSPLAAGAQTAPQPAAAQTAGTENPSVTGRAKDVLQRLQSNTIDRSQFSDQFNKDLTPDQLSKAGTQLAPFGEPQQFVYDSQLTRGNSTAYLYHVTLQRGQLDEIIAVDQSGKISALLFRNARLTNAAPAASPSP